MIMKMFAIKDKVIDEFNLPFCAKTEEQAKMMFNDGLFQQAAELKKSLMYEKIEVAEIKADLASRYFLFFVGSYDVEKGEIVETTHSLVSVEV